MKYECFFCLTFVFLFLLIGRIMSDSSFSLIFDVKMKLSRKLNFRYTCGRLSAVSSEASSSLLLPAREFYSSFSYDRFPDVEVSGLAVKLFPFQREGVGWMVRRERFHRGGIMADHLGMGKTVQMVGLCIAADTVCARSVEMDTSTVHLSFRLMTVLHQLCKMTIVANCTKLNMPSRDIQSIFRDVQRKVNAGEDVKKEQEEVSLWLSFIGKTHAVYEKRARAFLADAESKEESFDKVESTVLRTLVVVPAALLLQWKSEIETKVSPDRKLSVFVFHGKSKNVTSAVLENFDFVLTTYDTVAHAAGKSEKGSSSEEVDSFERSNAGPLFQILWKRIILDEAHVVRHAQTLRWKAIMQLRGTKRWAVTATPLHNTINDLQNLLQFTGCARLPVLPGTQSQSILEDPALQQSVAKALQAVFLRRGPVITRNGIREVLVELPPKHENTVFKSLSQEECKKYNDILSNSRSVIDKSVNTAHIFSLMTKLRLSCCHPWLANSTGVQVYPCGVCKCEAASCVTTKCGHTFCFECLLLKFREAEDGDNAAARIPCPTCETALPASVLQKSSVSPQQRLAGLKARELETSTKLEMLMSSIRNVLSTTETEKVIVFSHFTSFLDIIGLMLDHHAVEFLRLDGTMTLSARNSVIRSFQTTPKIRVLLASKTATGVGLNLTAANHVIIVDPWWNPAIEEQAVHRCHRIGQSRPVHVSRFIISDTIEHYCFEISRKKKEFGDAILRAATSGEVGAKSAVSKLQELLGRLNYVGGK